MMRKNGTDHSSVVDKVESAVETRVRFCEKSYLMLQFYRDMSVPVLCNTESNSFGRCCCLTEVRSRRLKSCSFFKLKILSFHIKSA